MKKLVLLLLCSPLMAFAQRVVTLPVDTKTSVLKWTGHSEVGTYAPTGTLAIHDGVIELKDGQFAGAKLNVDMKSLNQDNAKLTEHLKSADFFDVEKYPVCKIQIDKVENGMMAGSLMIKDKIVPFESPVQVTGSGKESIVNGKVTLDRTKYGIVYGSTAFFSGLGDHAIRNTFEVEFTIGVGGLLPAKYVK